MLDTKKFFNKKTVTLLVAVVVIIALLITAIATGGVLNRVDCPDCKEGECQTCAFESVIPCEHEQGVLSCEACEDSLLVCATCRGADPDCEVCAGAPVVDCPDCDDGVCSTCGGEGTVVGSFWALLPPIIAIGLALITKEVFSSLFIGIASGAILAANGNVLGTVDNVVSTGLISAVSGTAGIFIFLVELGILVALVNKAGGSRAFGEWAKKHVKSKVGAGLCTFALGILIFIDDYFNCLTVGSVMRPVTDKHKISRSKLAFLIDATAAPICMIAPISSWAAAVTQYAKDGQGLSLFIAAIPMNFYSILTLVFVIGLIVMKFDFGLMKKHEQNAENGDLFSGAMVSDNSTLQPNARGRVFDLVVPILVLLVSSIFALVYNGGILDGATFTEAFGNTDATVALPWSGIITLIITIIYMCIRKVVTFKEAMEAIPKGFTAMVPAILILTFATALKNMTGELGADFFVGDMMRSFPATLAKLLPAVIFIVSCILAFATGTSWGTFGILIPIVTAMFNEADPLFVLGISACLAGAVCGDHCSPISDTTIMSSAGAECEHLNHVQTQIPYALFVAIVSFVCFIIAGFIPVWYIMLPLGVAIMIGCLIVTKIIVKKLESKKA